MNDALKLIFFYISYFVFPHVHQIRNILKIHKGENVYHNYSLIYSTCDSSYCFFSIYISLMLKCTHT